MSFESEDLANIFSSSIVARKGGLGDSPNIPQNVRRQLRAAPDLAGPF